MLMQLAGFQSWTSMIICLCENLCCVASIRRKPNLIAGICPSQFLQVTVCQVLVVDHVCLCFWLCCRVDLLASCLKWRHLCPTAPDTLTCYPFADDDPFVMQTCPHIMFAGNQPEFDTQLLEGETDENVPA